MQTTQTTRHILQIHQPKQNPYGMNANKIEFLCFKQKGAIFTLKGNPQELVVPFTYLSNNISSTKSDVNIALQKHGTLLTGYRLYESLIYPIK